MVIDGHEFLLTTSVLSDNALQQALKERLEVLIGVNLVYCHPGYNAFERIHVRRWQDAVLPPICVNETDEMEDERHAPGKGRNFSAASLSLREPRGAETGEGGVNPQSTNVDGQKRTGQDLASPLDPSYQRGLLKPQLVWLETPSDNRVETSASSKMKHPLTDRPTKKTRTNVTGILKEFLITAAGRDRAQDNAAVTQIRYRGADRVVPQTLPGVNSRSQPGRPLPSTRENLERATDRIRVPGNPDAPNQPRNAATESTPRTSTSPPPIKKKRYSIGRLLDEFTQNPKYTTLGDGNNPLKSVDHPQSPKRHQRRKSSGPVSPHVGANKASNDISQPVIPSNTISHAVPSARVPEGSQTEDKMELELNQSPSTTPLTVVPSAWLEADGWISMSILISLLEKVLGNLSRTQ